MGLFFCFGATNIQASESIAVLFLTATDTHSEHKIHSKKRMKCVCVYAFMCSEKRRLAFSSIEKMLIHSTMHKKIQRTAHRILSHNTRRDKHSRVKEARMEFLVKQFQS